MATLTPAQQQAADAMMAGTFDKLTPGGQIQPPMSVQDMYQGIYPPAGAPQPTFQPGMMGRGQPTPAPDRLSPSPAGLPNPSPGSGMTPQQLAALGGYTVDPLTGKLALQPSQPQNPAAMAAAQVAQGVPLPRPRPGFAPTSIDMAAINGQQPMNPVALHAAGMNAVGGVPKGVGSVAAPAVGMTPQQPIAPVAPSYQERLNPAFKSLTPSQAYEAANIAAQIKAQQTKAASTGVGTNGYVYQNGQNMGTSPAMAGLTPAQQYEVANGRAPTAPAPSLTSLASGEAQPITPAQAAAMRQGNRQGVADLGRGY